MMQRRHLAEVRDPDEVGGTFIITNDALAQTVGLTVLECYGVVGMAARASLRVWRGGCRWPGSTRG